MRYDEFGQKNIGQKQRGRVSWHIQTWFMLPWLVQALHAKVHSTSKGMENHGWNHDTVKCAFMSCILNGRQKAYSYHTFLYLIFSSISSPFLSIAPFTAEDEARKQEKDRTGYFGGAAAAEGARVAIGGPQPTNVESWTSRWGLGRHFMI